MSKTKQALSEEALDALELVDEGQMTEAEWLAEYAPTYVDPVEKGGDVVV